MSGGSPLIVYTDGSCLGNPGPGGWAWAVPSGRYASGAEPRTTNQRMEIRAVLEALQALSPPLEPEDRPPGQDAEGAGDRARSLEVVSDSTYVVNCFRQRWWQGWYRRGWRNAAGKPVANRDLWEPLLEMALDPVRQVEFRWVRGHSGDHWNDVVDELATTAAASGVGASG